MGCLEVGTQGPGEGGGGWKGTISKGPEGTFRGGSDVCYLDCGNGFMVDTLGPNLSNRAL